MIDKIKCFISYTHEDADFESIEHMKVKLNEYANERIDILMDSDLHYGSNFAEYMQKLDTVDGIIVLFTPSYKKRVLNREGGVDYEYKRIKERYNKLLEAKQSGRNINDLNFVFIPVLFSV